MKGMGWPVLAAGGGEVVFSLQSPHLSWASSPSRVPYQQTGTLARARTDRFVHDKKSYRSDR